MITIMFKLRMRLWPDTRVRGFALPTVLIASIVMLVVLLSAVSATSSIRAALDDQYYNQLARGAAEAGEERADACLAANNYVITWNDSNRLRPDTTCTGSTIVGGDKYVMQSGNIRTSFIVWAPVVGTNGTAKVTVVGTTELIRQSTSTVYQTYSQTLSRTSGVQDAFSTDSSSGQEETCGIINQNTWCWGGGNYGKLGNGTTTTSLTPVKVVRESGVLAGHVDTQVAVGVNFACTVSDTRLYCWGDNTNGELGSAIGASSSVPVPVDTQSGMRAPIRQVVAGLDHTCAVTIPGDVYCWGSNAEGQLGVGSGVAQSSVPVRVAAIGAYAGLVVTNIATSIYSDTTCAIVTTASGPRAYCWGSNVSGQIGDGTQIDRFIPITVTTAGVLSGKNVTDISIAAAGSDGTAGHACAVASGAAYCWGNGGEGVLGNGALTNSLVPVAVTSSGVLSGKTVLEVNVGIWHVCATARNVSNVVSVHCWGQNDYGQLGSNQTPAQLAQSAVPVNVYVGAGGLQGRTITGLKGGGNRGCVIADQKTFCWGYNYIGQLGDGTTTTRNVPTEASFLTQKLPVITY